MDNLSLKDLRKNMQNIRSKNTLPERILATELRKNRIHFKRYAVSLTGKPDFIIKGTKIAVFVDSEFWHGRKNRFIMPKSNRRYWKAKILSNQLRDRRVNRVLRRGGWQVIRLWESDVKHRTARCVARIQNRLAAKHAAIPVTAYLSL